MGTSKSENQMAREQAGRQINLMAKEESRRRTMTPRQRHTAVAVDEILASANAAARHEERGPEVEDIPRPVDDGTQRYAAPGTAGESIVERPIAPPMMGKR